MKYLNKNITKLLPFDFKALKPQLKLFTLDEKTLLNSSKLRDVDEKSELGEGEEVAEEKAQVLRDDEASLAGC